MKKLFEIEFGYGKFGNMQLEWSEVMEDTKQNRENILDEYQYWDPESKYDLNEFIEGRSNTISFTRDGIDWDEAGCMIIQAISYEDKLKRLEEDYNAKVEKLKQSFK